MSAHEYRDQFGPWFKSVAADLGFDITHGHCECGSCICAYADHETGNAFAGFVMFTQWMAANGHQLAAREPIAIASQFVTKVQ